MITFKTFLEDIQVSDERYSRDESDVTVDRENEHFDKSKFKKLNLSIPFPKKDFSVWANKKTFVLVKAEDDKSFEHVALSLEMDTFNLIVKSAKISETLPAIMTISAGKDYQGMGLAPMLYTYLIEGGLILVSSRDQTPGGQSIWMRLLDKKIGVPFVIKHTWVSSVDKGKLSDTLVTGNVAKLKKLAYKSEDYRLMIVPKQHALLAKFENVAEKI